MKYLDNNKINECKAFERELFTILKGYYIDSYGMAYVLCYLSYQNAKLHNNPYINFHKYYVENSDTTLCSFINSVSKSFKDVDKKSDLISEAINYLKQYEFNSINGKVLLDLLKTKDLYFYEFILKYNLFTSDAGYNRGDENPTPKELIDILSYFKVGSRILDVGSGYGNIAIGLLNSSSQNIDVSCIDININKSLICKIRLDLCRNTKVNILSEDFLSYNDYPNMYSFITINMPFGLHITPMKLKEINLKNNSELDWYYSPATSSEWIYINKALRMLETNGRIAIISLKAPLYKTGDKKIRKDLIDRNLIEYIINMPSGTLPGVGVPYSLLIINNSKNDDLVKFVNCEDCYNEALSSSRKEIDSSRIIEMLSIEKYKSVSIDEISKNDYTLLPEFYVDSDKKTKLKNEIELSNLNVEISRGFQIFSKSDLTEAGKYSIVTISDIDENGNLSEELGKFNTDKDVSKFLLKKNDILITTKGTRIKTCIINDLKDVNTIYHGNITLIRLKDNKINPLFLKLYLDSKRGQLELKSIQTGSIIISINTSQLAKIKIPLLGLEEQNDIVNKYTFKKYEIDSLVKRLNILKSSLIDYTDNIFEGVEE